VRCWVNTISRDHVQAGVAGGFTRNVEFAVCVEAPIGPLIEELSFIKDKRRWGYVFRFGLFEIACRDFELIKAAMRAAI